MAVVTGPPGLPLWSDYPRFVRRHRSLIAVLIGTGLLAGFGWSLQQPTTFSATASVALTAVPVYVTPSATELVPPEVTIDTDAQLLRSPLVLGAVARVLGVPEEAGIDHLSVTASPSSRVLHVTITAASASKAAEAADAAVTAFIDVRRDSLGALTVDQLSQLRLRIADQERVLAQEQNKRLVIATSDTVFAQLLQRRTTLDELEEASREPATPLGRAVPPDTPDHANTEVPLTSGALLGLLGGCLLGAGRDRQARSRQSTDHRSSSPSGYLPNAVSVPEDYRHVV